MYNVTLKLHDQMADTKVVFGVDPLPCGTLATFFLMAVRPIQMTKEGDGREKTIKMMSLRLERAVTVRRWLLLITPLPLTCRGQCVPSHGMM